MTFDEVVDLLTLIAARDNRTVGRATALAWQEDVGDLEFADAREAVRLHFRESTEWLMAAHIRQQVKAIREQRLANSDLALPAADPDRPEDWARALRNITRRVADGREPFRAITGGAPRAEPSAEFKEVREDLAVNRQVRLVSVARDLEPGELDNAPTCDCGALLDPDGSCFACGTAATA